LESSPLTANETSWAAKFNTSVASKRKHLDSGSDSQEKLNVVVKENPQKKKREKKPREPSGNSLPFDPSQTCCIQLHKVPPEQYQGADAPKVDNIKNGKSKKGHVCAPSKRKLFKEMSKEQVLPEGLLAPSDFVPNCTEQNPIYTSRSAASLYQFCYGPACQDRNPQPPGTTDRLSMLPPRGYPSFELCELFANGTSKANNSLVRKLKKKDSGSGSSYGSQEKLYAKEKKNPEKKMGTTKQREPPPLLTPAEKCSDKYRRVSLDQLVPPPRSPHNLLQEEYASDPWKVIVICMLLNLTHGKQVSSKIVRLIVFPNELLETKQFN
jgi:methyl-CpG-binding domain protein 4